MFVGLGFVGVVVGLNAVEVGELISVGTGVTVLIGVFVAPNNGGNVFISNNAPGVRKLLMRICWVRMDGSTGSYKLSGRLVRKSLSGSRFDLILVSNLQRGEKRAACSPATITHRNPIKRMIRMMIQSRRSRSDVFPFSRIFLVSVN